MQPIKSKSQVESMKLPHERVPQQGSRSILPEGTTVVSADGHWSINEDIWYEAFPPSMRDKAPRVWLEDDIWQIGSRVDKPYLTKETTSYPIVNSLDRVPGITQLEPRLRDLSVEGIDKEIVFGGINVMLLFFGEASVRTEICRVYNQYMADIASKAPDRFYPVAYMPVWDMENADTLVQEIVDLGFKSVFVPQKAIGSDGKVSLYQEDEMIPFWSAMEASGLPVCFHIGEQSGTGRGGIPTTILNNMQFRETFGQLVFGGVFDRHPALRIAFVEANVNWVPGMLQDAGLVHAMTKDVTYPIKMTPVEYWQRHCWATIIDNDKIGLQHIDDIGADKIMYGPDYPHVEGSFGRNWTVMESIVDQVGDDRARDILGGNAIRFFNL